MPEGSPTLEDYSRRCSGTSRFLIVVPVIVGILMAAGTFYVACVDTVYLLRLASRIADITLTEEMRQGLRAEIMASVVKVTTISLIGAALLLFSTGLYQPLHQAARGCGARGDGGSPADPYPDALSPAA